MSLQVIPSVLSCKIPVKVSVKLISPVSGFRVTVPKLREGSSGVGFEVGSHAWVAKPCHSGPQLSSETGRIADEHISRAIQEYVITDFGRSIGFEVDSAVAIGESL